MAEVDAMLLRSVAAIYAPALANAAWPANLRNDFVSKFLVILSSCPVPCSRPPPPPPPPPPKGAGHPPHRTAPPEHAIVAPGVNSLCAVSAVMPNALFMFVQANCIASWPY